MKGTSIFQFKSWPKIHQPLPRTPRESEQLLNALTSSFRRQLDRAYPVANNSPGAIQESDRQPVNADSSVHATDQHLHNILDNPLFRIVPPKAAGTAHDHHFLQSLDEQRRLAKEPMIVLDELMASGSATAVTIIGCLKAQLLLARSTRHMKESRAGSRVQHWYWSSDGASRQMLLQSRASIASLAKFMVAEGLQGTMLEWLRMAMSQDLGGYNGRLTDGQSRQIVSQLLVGFMDAEIRYGAGLASAMRFYLRVCQMHFSTNPTDGAIRGKPMLLAAGAHLSRAAMDQKPSIEQVSDYLYDEFSEVISTLSSSRSLLFASVALCHPGQPNPQPYIRFVDTLSPAKFQGWSETRRDAFLRIGCDALRLLIERKKIREASGLAQQIQQVLPEKTATASAEATRARASAEEEYLLSRLDLNLT
ncbi:hypothetical protein N7532_004150 [Penicillium argentinense]|uniref:Uncharacterized protein n=1 Tax=Penicillium argentinense TaxID=1131581 RepID=A0A9W9KF84_9EURO|nr:uncharacterized protein N7532_004150 [Penicillium argentinense]KAJ5103621.1 hypothetical protein N7532_004150 [Penicillium argentinense]